MRRDIGIRIGVRVMEYSNSLKISPFLFDVMILGDMI